MAIVEGKNHLFKNYSRFFLREEALLNYLVEQFASSAQSASQNEYSVIM
jgi:hypothetical protein